MLITLDHADPRPIYVQIMDEIQRAILVGTLQADEPLPSVRQLAVQLRVNPNTVAQAYRELERRGVVHVRRGQGTFANPGAASDAQRRSVARAVATRALRDARRNGLDADDLIRAIRAATTDRKKETA